MATKLVRRTANRPERSPYARPVALGGGPSKPVCFYWSAGRCTKKFCKYLHPDAAPSAMNPHKSNPRGLVWTKEENATGKGNLCNAGQISNAAQKSSATPKCNGSPKSVGKVCKFWITGNCVKGDRCSYLHKWFCGESLSMLPKLQGHNKAVTGIALSEGYDKLFSAGKDGVIRVWLLVSVLG